VKRRDGEKVAQRRLARSAWIGALLAVFACVASTAWAGESEAPVKPPLVTREVPPVVVRAVEPGDLPADPSSFTTVIDVGRYRGEVTSVEELLERTPGVQIRRFGGEGQPAEISIRGSTASQVDVQLDGVTLNSAQSGAVDLSTIPLSLLERIEVSRGGGSVQAGSDAIGGVVNLVTRRPGGERRSNASLSGGSWNTWRGNAATSGTARGLEYALAYDGFGTDGDFEFRRPALDIGGVVIEPDPETATRINNQAETHAGLLALGHDLGEKAHVTVRDQLFYASRGQPGLDAGSVGAAGQRARAHERLTRNVLGATLEAAELTPARFDATLDFWHRYERTHFRDPETVPSLGTTIDTEDRNDELGSRLGFAREIPLFETLHRASLSLEAQHDALRSDSFEDRGRNAGAVVLQDDIGAFEQRVRVIPALRWDRTEGFGARWLPRIGAIVTPLPWLRVKGNLERSFRVPNFDELYFPDRGFVRGNPALQPEEATNADVGAKIAAARLGPVTDAFLEAAYFHNDVDDSIVFLLVSPSLVEPRNTGAATIDGVELSGGFRVFDWVDVSASYTHLDARIDATDAFLPGRAADETSVRVALGPPSRAVQLIGEVQITSDIPVSDSGNTILPSRTVWDAAISVDLVRLGWVPAQLPARSLLLTLEGKNLGDVAVRDAQFFPQPGRSFALRVETAW
jgi:outer membrane cobalamin receptor